MESVSLIMPYGSCMPVPLIPKAIRSLEGSNDLCRGKHLKRFAAMRTIEILANCRITPDCLSAPCPQELRNALPGAECAQLKSEVLLL